MPMWPIIPLPDLGPDECPPLESEELVPRYVHIDWLMVPE